MSASAPLSAAQAVQLANRIDAEGFTADDVDQAMEALRVMAKLVIEAPKYFAPEHDFEGQKLAWLQKAGLVKSKPTVKPKAQKA